MTQPQYPPGLVAMICTSGSIKGTTAQCLSDMRSYNDRHGIHAVEYQIIPAALVEAGRDEAAAHALRSGYAWMLQIDGDAVFVPDALEYALQRWLPQPYDVIGAYCQLRGPQGRPTIDTGSGTWEEHYPGEGVLNVIRTGGHFLFVKTPALRMFGPPWFRTRLPQQPLRAMADVDNYARTKRGGSNPLRTPEWEELLQEAAKESHPMTSVGEDSGFCDALKAAGGSIAVDTDFCVGHLTEETIWPTRFIDFMRQVRLTQRLALGILP